MPPINDIKKEKKDVIVIVVVISLIVFIFLWRFVFSVAEQEYIPTATIKTAPDVDFDYLKGPEFNYFHKYEQIDPLDENLMGRDNPFLSH